MAKKNNIAQIVESWTPAIKQMTKNMINESSDRMEWMCEYAHNHTMALNENAAISGGVTFPIQNLYNTVGVGNAVPASMAGQTAADQANPASFGSGDKWPSLLPIALQVAARTVGFDLVNTIPLQGPTGVLPYLDYVYAGSKQPFGATPAHDAASANPAHRFNESDKAYENYETAHAFRCQMTDASNNTKKEILRTLRAATNINFGGKMSVQYIGPSRLAADPMFKVLDVSTGQNLGKIFADAANNVSVTVDGSTMSAKNVRLISALEDQVLGFTGAGKYDSDAWSGTYMNPFKLYDALDRATGEQMYPRQMSLQMFTKFVQVGTQSVAVAVTQEQVQDLNKQWGIDVIKLVENAAINELSQSINKHILSRIGALGWKNAVNTYNSEGINLNLDFTQINVASPIVSEVSFATYDETGEYTAAMPVPLPTTYGDFENADTMYKRIAVNVLAAANLIMNRGRRGSANFIVTNWKIASMLQSNSQYAFAPYANTINQNNGTLYPVGSLMGMTLMVDPMMASYDTRVIVGRKGGKEEPSLCFCPYILAESIQYISELTAAPKILIKSRYALVDLGWYPETQYFTFYVKTPDTL